MTPSRWDEATNVLCVRLDALGDVLMTTPAIAAVRRAVEGRRVTLLTSSVGGAIAQWVPEVDDVWVYDAPWMKSTRARDGAAGDRELIERLRSGGFDAAIIFTVYSQSALPAALMCFLAEIPLRLAHCRENPYQLLTDWVLETEPTETVRHEVTRQLALVATVGCTIEDERLRLRVAESAENDAARRLRDAGVDATKPWLVMHPGASAPSRRYPPEGFAAAARRLALGWGCQVVFTGSEAERPLIEEIRRQMRAASHSLAGQLELDELIGLLAAAPLLISNNTGPVHIAAAVGTPVVDLYALTNPQHTPWGVPHRVLYHDVECKYCYKSICPAGHHQCLRGVAPAAIVEAAQAMLAAGHTFRPTRQVS